MQEVSKSVSHWEQEDIDMKLKRRNNNTNQNVQEY